MPPGEIEDKPYTEGTLTKLEIFQLYARAWLPVFTSPPDPHWKRLHVFDFFAGKGRDVEGTPGSPVRLLSEISRRWNEIEAKSLSITLTCCDSDHQKVQSLTDYVTECAMLPKGLIFDAQPGEFCEMFARCLPALRDPSTACLVLLDQYGFKEVDKEVFQQLTACPVTDVLFFVSTQHLHRFSEHPSVRKYIELERAEDYYHAHQPILKWYRSIVPVGISYFLAPFSFRKGSNIYSVIFGSGHPRGMEQFLTVAWQKDQLNGEADYDLNREDFDELKPYLPMDLFDKPKKVQVFEASLEASIRSQVVSSEADIYLFCLEQGMLPKHASPVLQKLKNAAVIDCEFRSPSRRSLEDPRPFRVR